MATSHYKMLPARAELKTTAKGKDRNRRNLAAATDADVAFAEKRDRTRASHSRTHCGGAPCFVHRRGSLGRERQPAPWTLDPLHLDHRSGLGGRGIHLDGTEAARRTPARCDRRQVAVGRRYVARCGDRGGILAVVVVSGSGGQLCTRQCEP